MTLFDPGVVLDQIEDATAQLLQTAARLSDVEVRDPSLLPGWSRGHVLTHVARNADGGRHLLSWARTGVETPEYPSMAARSEQIESGSGRSGDALVADLRASAAHFADEYRRMPRVAWTRTVRWTQGQEHPALRAADARLTEVLVHHVDLDKGFTPEHWPADFVGWMLTRVVAAFAARDDVPAMRLEIAETGFTHTVGRPSPTTVVRGPQSWMLAWLIGRSAGANLVSDGDALTRSPFVF